MLLPSIFGENLLDTNWTLICQDLRKMRLSSRLKMVICQ